MSSDVTKLKINISSQDRIKMRSPQSSRSKTSKYKSSQKRKLASPDKKVNGRTSKNLKSKQRKYEISTINTVTKHELFDFKCYRNTVRLLRYSVRTASKGYPGCNLISIGSNRLTSYICQDRLEFGRATGKYSCVNP